MLRRESNKGEEEVGDGEGKEERGEGRETHLHEYLQGILIRK